MRKCECCGVGVLLWWWGIWFKSSRGESTYPSGLNACTINASLFCSSVNTPPEEEEEEDDEEEEEEEEEEEGSFSTIPAPLPSSLPSSFCRRNNTRRSEYNPWVNWG